MGDLYFNETGALLDAIASVFSQLYRSAAGGLLACAFWGDRFVTGSLAVAEQAKPSRAPLDYGSLHLREQWISADGILPLLRELESGTARLDGKLLGKTAGGGYLRRRLDETNSGWPEWQAQIRHEKPAEGSEFTRNLPHDPVLAFGSPPYLNAFHAMNEWVFGVVRSWDATHVKADEFSLYIPDTRARFIASEWSPGRVRLEVELNVPADNVQVQLRFLGSRTHPTAMLPVTRNVENDVPEDAESVVAFLVHSNGDHIATARVGRWSQPPAKGTDEPMSVAERAAAEIAGGEGPYVEFKEFVRPKDPKEEEIERTIVAFANTGGGRLYVGVRNDRTLQGASAAREAGKEPDVEKSIAVLARRIENEIANWIKPEKPRVLVHKVELSGCPILAVHVEEGEQVYSTGGDETICVRRGASSAKASVAEIRELFDRSARGDRLLGVQFRIP